MTDNKLSYVVTSCLHKQNVLLSSGTNYSRLMLSECKYFSRLLEGHSGLVVCTSDCGLRGPRFESHSGQ